MNFKEYLDPDNGFALIKQVGNLPFADPWIEVPEGAEKYLSGAAFIVSGPATPFFYKKENGHDCEFYENDWHIHSRPLHEKYFNDVLWARNVPEQGLISGADVPALLKSGQLVQYRVPPNGSLKGGEWVDVNLEKDEEEFSLGDFINARYEWRLKPLTIKLELEIPAPFEPKVGEVFFVLYPTAVGGYSKMHITDQKRMDDYAKLGAWRTEEEIKQVVAALRGIKG